MLDLPWLASQNWADFTVEPEDGNFSERWLFEIAKILRICIYKLALSYIYICNIHAHIDVHMQTCVLKLRIHLHAKELSFIGGLKASQLEQQQNTHTDITAHENASLDVLKKTYSFSSPSFLPGKKQFIKLVFQQGPVT